MSPFIYLDLLLFAFLLEISYRFYQARRVRINNQILFSFCDLRRNLMALARNEEVDIQSKAFQFYYMFLSKMIHYVRDYKFLSDLFLELLNEELRGDGCGMDAKTTIIRSETWPMVAIDQKFYKTMCDAFFLADFLFSLKYKIIIGKKRQKYKKNEAALKKGIEISFGPPALAA